MNPIPGTLAILLISLSMISCGGQKTKPEPQPPIGEEKLHNLHVDTTSQLMDETVFWTLIDKSRTAAHNDYQVQINSLKTILQALDPIEIQKFDNRFTDLMARSYDSKLWGAAFVINGGCSDDCFDYFRQYLIGKGKEKFYQTLKDPDSCADWIKSEEEDNWEGLQYAAMNAYGQKTGSELPKSYIPKVELKGKLFDQETVQKGYPRLAKKFMEE